MFLTLVVSGGVSSRDQNWLSRLKEWVGHGKRILVAAGDGVRRAFFLHSFVGHMPLIEPGLKREGQGRIWGGILGQVMPTIIPPLLSVCSYLDLVLRLDPLQGLHRFVVRHLDTDFHGVGP